MRTETGAHEATNTNACVRHRIRMHRRTRPHTFANALIYEDKYGFAEIMHTVETPQCDVSTKKPF